MSRVLGLFKVKVRIMASVVLLVRMSFWWRVKVRQDLRLALAAHLFGAA